MDARSCPARRSLEEGPSRFPTRIGPGHGTRSRAGSRNGVSACAKAIPRILNCCVRARGPTIRPTSAGTHASKPASWRCVCLHRSIWDARQAPGPCSTICRAIQPCKPQGFACPAPAGLSGSFLGKPVVFCPSHKGNSGPTPPREPLEEIQMDAQRCE
jgi:hypothetical protein